MAVTDRLIGPRKRRSAVESHGMSRSREYCSWASMRSRCYSPTDPTYEVYGGAGIGVCPAWLDSFVAFFTDMGPRPAGYSLDRIDSTQNYTPENCRWADTLTQSRNRRSVLRAEIDGVTASMSEHADRYGVNYRTLVYPRLRAGWSPESALKTPPQTREERRAALAGHLERRWANQERVA
jgi:hypothetical protein